MALHSRYAVTVSSAVATRSRADCSSMEDRRRKFLINVHHRHRERGHKRPYQPKHSPSYLLNKTLCDFAAPFTVFHPISTFLIFSIIIPGIDIMIVLMCVFVVSMLKTVLHEFSHNRRLIMFIWHLHKKVLIMFILHLY